MIIGQTIVAVDLDDGSGNNATTVYTPWIASWGNAAIFSYEIIAITGALGSFTVKVYTKNSEEADPGTPKGTASTQSATSITPATYSITDAIGLLELVRLEFKLTALATEQCCTAQVHFRPLNPSWKTN